MSKAITFAGILAVVLTQATPNARAQGTPVLRIDDRVVSEGGAVNAAFRVTLSAPAAGNVTVSYSTSAFTAYAGEDFTATSGILTFTPGRTSHSIIVPIVSDTDPEPDEEFFVDLSAPSGATIETSRGRGTITNPPADAQVAMFRSYNRQADYHFFTTSLGSRNFAVGILGFQDESVPVPFYVLSIQRTGSVPLFRMFNPNLGRHYYTADVASRDFLMSIGMTYEMVEGFVYPLGPTPPAGATELFRLYNNNSGTHLFTADAAQKDGILQLFPGVWIPNESVGYVATSGVGDLFAGASGDPGALPTPVSVSFDDGSGNGPVSAYPGQVVVFFNAGVAAAEAESAITSRGATILARIPAAGYYLAATPPGTEGALVASLTSDARVALSLPHVYGTPSASVSVIDNCAPGGHGSEVTDSLVKDNGTFDECRHIEDADERWPASLLVPAILTEANQNGVGPTLINLSGAGGQYEDLSDNLIDWTSIPAGDPFRLQMQREWRAFIGSALLAIASLPAEYRAGLVVTIAAGNSNMDISGPLAELRKNARIAEVLKNNVLVVTTTAMVDPHPGNFAPGDPDVAIRNNADAANGTSFAAPSAMAVIQNVMKATGASPRLALKAVKLAVLTNHAHNLIESEAIDKARKMLEGLKTDPPEALDVTGIAFSSVGAATTAVITPGYANVTVSYTVSGTDGYYDSGTQKTSATGSVSFSIPAGADGVVDTISVTAVTADITARTTYTW